VDFTPDSPIYLDAGKAIISGFNLFNAWRTPGYPGFLAAVHTFVGDPASDALVLAQTILSVFTSVEAYVLSYRLTHSRSAAVVTAALIGTNLHIIDWERAVMTETLATWEAVTILLIFQEWLTKTRRRPFVALAIAFVALSVFAILTRPTFLYLPALLLAVWLFAKWQSGDIKIVLTTAALIALGIYAPIWAYASINDRLSPGAGLSGVLNVNLFGKVIEYRMQNGADATRFGQIRLLTDRFVAAGGDNPYEFGKDHPEVVGPYYVEAAAFSRSAIIRNPVVFIGNTLPVSHQAWLGEPYRWAPSFTPPWIDGLTVISLAGYHFYLLLPAVLLYGFWAWRKTSVESVVLFGILAAVCGMILTSSAFSYTDFGRLREPGDPLMLVAGCAILTSIARAAAARLMARLQGRGRL
jgi:hypothetical protein